MNTIKKYSYDMFKMMLNQLGIAMLALVMTMATFQNDKLYFTTSVLCIVFYIYLLYAMMYDIGRKDKPAIDGGRSSFNPLKGLWISLGANAINIICGVMIAVFSFFIVMQSPVTVLDTQGNEMKVYTRVEIAETMDASDYTYIEAKLYSNTGGNVYTVEAENSKYSETVNRNGGVVSVYDENGNELELFSESGMRLCTHRNSVKTWASNLYGVPYVIATFLQSMFAGVRDRFFNSNDFFYLMTPVLPVFFTALAYYMGVKGKRILFFLPERKQKPRY
ncbi:MAG: hypothetical protein IJB24_04305 [Clostridia bacterium]|nr:hypothetical protein [Clostridia bacterium]